MEITQGGRAGGEKDGARWLQPGSVGVMISGTERVEFHDTDRIVATRQDGG